MAIQTSCPHAGCGQKYRVEKSQAGQTVVCRSCGRQFTVAAAEHETSLSAQGADTRSPQHQTDAPEKHEKTPKRLGRFEIRSRLGAGAFGAVYRAHDPVLDREVALKIPRASALEHPEAKARFLREPKAAAKLSHPNIVPVYDAGSDGHEFYIASAFIEGRTLKAVLEEEPPKLRRTAQIVRQLADALDYAHRMGVVHRDVKPANVMLDSQCQPMLMDFGLARLVSSTEEKLTQDGTVMGTPAYMAPEQADGSLGEVGPASDQYSLGVVLYEMLCGETPFAGPPAVLIFNAIHKTPVPPRTKDAALPRDLESIGLKAMSKRAEDRYPNCGQFAEDLRRWLDDEPIRARRRSLGERAVKWAKREPALAALGLAVALLAVVSTLLAVGFLASRQAMARAVAYEEKQTALAESETARADEQTRRAIDEERRAAENEKSAKDKEQAAKTAREKLETAVEARKKADVEGTAASERGTKMTEDVKHKESKIAETNDAIDEANRKAQAAEEAEKTRIAVLKFPIYTYWLERAAQEYGREKKAWALGSLKNCPIGSLSWEWDYLKILCDGKMAGDDDIPRVAWGELVLSSNLRFACKRPAAGHAFRVLELPDLKPVAEVSVTGVAAEGIWYLSPAGNALLAQATPSDWLLISLADNKRTLLHDRTPVEPFPFTPDGNFVLLREESRIALGGTGAQPAAKAVLISIASPETTTELERPTEGLRFAPTSKPIIYGTRKTQPVILCRWSVPPNAVGAIPCVETTLDGISESTLLALSQDGTLVVLSAPPGHKPGDATGITIYHVGVKKIVFQTATANDMIRKGLGLNRKPYPFRATTASEYVALSPDGRRVLLRDHIERRFSLFDVRCQQRLPRLKYLPWENFGATQLQMNAEWTRAIMARDSDVRSIHCWSTAHHVGEK